MSTPTTIKPLASPENPAPATTVSKPGKEKNPNVIFPKTNILMMLGCICLIIVGFLLMAGGSSSVEGGFNPDIFSTRRIVIGPTIAFLGFLLMAFSIIWTPKSKNKK